MPAEQQPDAKRIFIVSDASGGTGERVVRATLAQFAGASVVTQIVPRVKRVAQIRRVVRRAAECRGLIAYTLVAQPLRNEIVSLANETGVDTVDLMGPLMTALSKSLAAVPAYRPGLFLEASAEHYERLEAVSFTVRHDDGLLLNELPLADLVIVGPSRTAKTPLSVYLAHTRGLRVANVPLALGVEPFEELLALERGRVVGLTMNARLLARIRVARLKELGNPAIDYAQMDYIERELRHCHAIYRRSAHWPVVDVTGKSIEEVAAEVCALTVDAPAK